MGRQPPHFCVTNRRPRRHAPPLCSPLAAESSAAVEVASLQGEDKGEGGDEGEGDGDGEVEHKGESELEGTFKFDAPAACVFPALGGRKASSLHAHMPEVSCVRCSSPAHPRTGGIIMTAMILTNFLPSPWPC